MKREDDQQLWDLLGQTRSTAVSPFFARNVVRTIRERPQRFDQVRRWFNLRRIIPAAALAAAIVAALLVVHRPASFNPGDRMPDAVAGIDPQDYDVVADLDELMASDDTNLWDDDTQTL